MLKNYLHFFFLLIQISLWAQQNDISDFLAEQNLRPAFAVKMSLMNHLDFLSPAFQAGVEYKLNNKFNIQHDVGFYSQYASLFPFDEGTGLSGFKFRNELKYYYRENNEYELFYYGPDLMVYWYRAYRDKDYMRFGGAYQQTMRQPETKFGVAGHFKVGMHSYVMQSKFFIDVSAGPGVRYLLVQKEKAPVDAELSDNFSLLLDEGEYFLFSMVISVKVGYTLR